LHGLSSAYFLFTDRVSLIFGTLHTSPSYHPRLISERTVEENILKKANQKRMLGDMAIEGGNFTTAYFKQVQDKIFQSGQKRTVVPVGVPPAY
jgi:hypothetical protein